MRLNKYLARALGVSRREADELIVGGKVKVGERVAKLGEQAPDIDNNTKVWYNEKIVPPLEQKGLVYLALNKPVGYVSSRRAQGDAPTLYELLPEKYRSLKTVGRLDKNSSGLIILTNDGDFAFQMTHPKFRKVKLYEVSLDQPLQPLHQQMLADFGVELTDGKSQLGLTSLDDSRRNWQVALSEGRNRQIRRSFGSLGITVTKLHRTQFGSYQLGDLPSGKYRTLSV
ncbi:MAG: rRNA pseudouridine synthase [Candidatus Nomurabacteria bacterium]|jgi:23S rRNA pseudouridine2605 synthase|nr:rRNA pseudouridine synthase [Candidatus Nomurabacteria bacterium]